jgi:hypothetical protein
MVHAFSIVINQYYIGCDLVLLALDGVYLFEPRTTTFLEFHPASRVDIAIRCPANTTVNDEAGNLIARIEVVDNLPGPANIDLTAWKWNRPNYLRDLRSLPLAGRWSADIDLYQPLINRRTYKGIDRRVALHEAELNTVEVLYETGVVTKQSSGY